MIKKYAISIGFVTALIGHASAGCLTEEQYPNAWSDTRYNVHNNATATDTVTGLMWKVCAEGQLWTNAPSCTGTASQMTWAAALQQAALNNTAVFAGYSDWRLPNIKELSSLVALNCSAPAINRTVFPATGTSPLFWSASPSTDLNFSGNAWVVDFSDGFDNVNGRTSGSRVRLVRSGQ